MAIYHLSAKVVSRGKGQSAIAAAAYRSSDPLVDERTGELKSYEQRALRIIHKEIMAPAHAPAWARDRNALWNAAERSEKRKDAQLAREIEVSLPHELTEQQRLHLVKDFAREAFVRRGYAVDISIHTPDRGADGRNHHAHLMITMRVLGPDGFAPMKDRTLNTTEQLDAWRAQWANLANRHLARHGHETRIDHRSLQAQGIEREATTHVGYAGAEIAARGGQSDRMDEHSAIVERNGVRAELRAADAELAQLRELVANENRQRRQASPPERRTRTMQDGPTDDELKRQPEREAMFLAHMQKEHVRAEAILAERQRAQELDSRAQAFQQAKAQEAEEGRKRQAARDEAENRDGRNGDIGSAAARYSIALGQCYDVRDPYASLARAAGAEAAAFHRGQEALRAQAAAAKTPEQRQTIELRRRIEACEYMAITSDRLAGISVAVTGRPDSGQAVTDRQQAAHWRAQAAALREERGTLLEAAQAQAVPDKDRKDSEPPRATVASLEERRSAGTPYRTQMPATAPVPGRDKEAAPAPPVPIHPTLPRAAPAPKAAPATAKAEQPARSAQIPDPPRETQPVRPATPAAPANDTARPVATQPAAPAQPEPTPQPVRVDAQPFAAVALKPHSVTLAKPVTPEPVSPAVAEQGNDAAPARPEAAPAPQPEPQKARAAEPVAPARAFMAKEAQPEAQRAPAENSPQPFGAIPAQPHAVVMPKTATPRGNETAAPAVTRRFAEASAEDRAAARAAGVTIRRVSEPTTEPTNSRGVTRTVEVTDRKAVTAGMKGITVRRVTGIDRDPGRDRENERGGRSR